MKKAMHLIMSLLIYWNKIDEKDVPLNYSRFYKKYVQTEKSNLKKIKINNKVIHQSKLINYLKGDLDEDETKKDLNDILKKVKKNKKYFVSIKDIILLETLKSDGIEFDKNMILYMRLTTQICPQIYRN